MHVTNLGLGYPAVPFFSLNYSAVPLLCFKRRQAKNRLQKCIESRAEERWVFLARM